MGPVSQLEVTFVLRGCDFEDDTLMVIIANSVLAEHSWFSRGHGNLVTFTFDDDGTLTDFLTHTLGFADLVHRFLPGVRVIHVYRDMLTLNDIARVAETDTEQVRQWRTTYLDFPPVDIMLGGHYVWTWGDINNWLLTHPDLYTLSYAGKLVTRHPSRAFLGALDAALDTLTVYP